MRTVRLTDEQYGYVVALVKDRKARLQGVKPSVERARRHAASLENIDRLVESLENAEVEE